MKARKTWDGEAIWLFPRNGYLINSQARMKLLPPRLTLNQ